MAANPASGELKLEPEPVSEPVDSIDSPQATAQMGGNEPIRKTSASVDEPITPTGELLGEPVQVEPTPVSQPQPTESALQAEAKPPQLASISLRDLAHALLAKARSAIQFRKRKKLDKVMTLFLQRSKITNDEVEKFLHVSDATATRYLSQLENDGKIKQIGKTGKGVSYLKI
jgi:hypothetical protein